MSTVCIRVFVLAYLDIYIQPAYKYTPTVRGCLLRVARINDHEYAVTQGKHIGVLVRTYEYSVHQTNYTIGAIP